MEPGLKVELAHCPGFFFVVRCLLALISTAYAVIFISEALKVPVGRVLGILLLGLLFSILMLLALGAIAFLILKLFNVAI